MFTSAWEEAELLYVECPSALRVNVLNFALLKGMSVYSNSTKRPPQWSAFAAMLCVYHYQRSSTSILIASVLHGHFDFSAAGFRSFRRWRLSSKSRRWPENAWTTPSVVQRCLSCMSVFELTSNAAAQTYADVFVLSQLVVGGGSTQRVIFIYIKKGIGLDEIDIFIWQKMCTFWMKVFL